MASHHVNERECVAAGIDPDDVDRIRRRIQRVINDADKLGIRIFMGSASSLRGDDGGSQLLILASLTGDNCDGGCGAEQMDRDGLWRGE